jgi:hypothetical protein
VQGHDDELSVERIDDLHAVQRETRGLPVLIQVLKDGQLDGPERRGRDGLELGSGQICGTRLSYVSFSPPLDLHTVFDLVGPLGLHVVAVKEHAALVRLPLRHDVDRESLLGELGDGVLRLRH